MAADDNRVVVDSHLWIEMLSGRTNTSVTSVKTLIRTQRVVLVGPVVYEVLIGPRHEAQRAYLQSRLRAIPLLATNEAVWMRAVELGRLPSVALRKVPFSDVLIAAHCEVHACALFTRDPHFDTFPKLKRHSP
jgi:predicted nucleic acid-binding protein